MANLVYQFKISLEGISPTIWRRILVPEKYSFWDLHVAIQDAMGWMDCHLHEFKIKGEIAGAVARIGIPDEEDLETGREVLPGWEVPVSAYLTDIGMVAKYWYDFGDDWMHEVVFEGVLLREKGKKYPKCIGGERACPPEDCGGIPGYYNLLEVLKDKKHEEYENMVSWLKGHYKNYHPYDPGHFEPGKVKFMNPEKRWEIAFGEDM